MKKNYFATLFLLFTAIYSFGQVSTGDFQSKSSGPSVWNDFNSWQIYDGTTFVDATSSDGYPGELAGIYTVTIQAGHTINIESDLSTASMGDVIVNGTLDFNSVSSQQIITLVTSTLYIHGDNLGEGNLIFSGVKVRLNLQSSSVIIIDNGGTISGTCTHNDEIYLGTLKYAVCVGGGSSVYTFGEVIAAGGNVNAKIIDPATGPIEVTGCTPINLEGGYDGLETNVTYKWTLRDPNDEVTIIDSGTLANNSETTSTSFTPTIEGEYLVTLEITTTALATNIEARVFNVTDNELPTVITKNATVYLDAAGSASITAENVDNGSSDSCGAVTLSVSPSTFSCSDTTKPVLSDLIISEYVEGSDNNKYIEIYNGTGSNINLSNYSLRLYSNGVSTPSRDNPLSGTLASGATIVYSNSAAVIYLGATTNNTAVNFSGDDAIELYKILLGTSVDIFGSIGEDPGTAWTAGGNTTMAKTLRRNSTVLNGVTTNPTTGFPTLASEWDMYDKDDVSGLGSHCLASVVPVVLTVTDINGNNATETTQVFVVDNLGPVWTTVAGNLDRTIQCSDAAAISAAQALAPVATDNCGSVTYTKISSDFVVGSCPSSGAYTNTWISTDGCSNGSTTFTQTITVEDTTAPVLTVPADVTIECTTDESSATNGVATGSDTCGSVTITESDSEVTACGNTKTITRTWTATDACGNTTSANQIITVEDTTVPVFAEALPADATVECDAVPTAPTLTATDTCGASPVVTYAEVRTDGSCPSSYSLARTWTAIDACGLTTVHTQTIAVQDTTAPLFVEALPADATVECDAVPTAPTLTATDTCGASPVVTYAEVRTDSSCPSSYSLARTWIAIDACGLTTVHTQTIAVQDTTAPSFVEALPADATVECDAVPTAPTLTATDTCGASPVVTYAEVRTDGSCPSSYSLARTWTATDACGLTTVHTQTIAVQDTTAPLFVEALPADATVECDAVPTAPTLTATDNCDASPVVTYAEVRTDGSCPSSYSLARTWTATDACGLTTSANQIITVEDTTAPTASNPSSTSGIQCISNIPAIDVNVVTNEADNCSTPIVSFFSESNNGGVGSTSSPYVLTRIYRVTDACGNYKDVSHTITVIDNEAPIVPSLNVLEQCSYTLTTAPIATDNCAVTVTGTTGDYTLPHTFDTQGDHTITWAFNDGHGNITTETQHIVIDDIIAPVFDIDSLPTINSSECELTIPAPTATDVCEGVIIGTPDITFPITTEGTIDVTWTYDDGNGNTATQTQTVTTTASAIDGGSLLGYLNDIIPTPDATDNIAITSCPDDFNPITIDLTGEVGTIIQWEKFEAGNAAWEIIPLTVSEISNNAHKLKINFSFQNTKSTLFRVLIQDGETCAVYSNMVNVHAIPPDIPPILDETNFNICLTEEITLIARSGYTSTVAVDDGGDFNTGQFPDKWDPTQWKIDGEVAGTAWTAAADDGRPNNWSGTNDHPVGTLYEIEYDNTKSGKKFGIAHGDFTSDWYITNFPDRIGLPTTLETPIFSLVGLETASIDFDQAYNLEAGDYALLELSLDGGLTYTITLQELLGSTPTNTWDWASNPLSTADHYIFNNDDSSFDVSDYIGNDNVRVRWSFYGTTDESAWAIDDITIPVKPYSDLIEWTDGIGDPDVPPITTGTLEVEYTFAPTSPGVHEYGATTLINGCRAYDPEGTAIATVVVNYAYAGEDYTPLVGECGGTSMALNAYDNFLTATENKTNGAYPGVLDQFSEDPGTDQPGIWTIVSSTSTCGPSSFSDDTDPRAIFSAEAGVHVLRWTAAGCSSDVSITLSNCDVVDFDGEDDYITFKNNYDLSNGSFSIEVWIKPEADPTVDSPIQTIISKRNGNGYDLRLTNNIISFNWNTSGSLASPYPISVNRWYHIAVTFNGNTYKIYIDGIEAALSAGSPPVATSLDCFVGAMDQTGNPPNRPINHFSGWMDELRIWNKALNVEHIRQMMNQEIKSNGTAVIGEVIPMDIHGPDNNGATGGWTDNDSLLWSNLIGYYRMNDINCGYMNSFNSVGVEGKLRNITSAQPETAPLPYESVRDGDWTNRTLGVTPWKWGATVWDYPNSIGIDNTSIDWNIVRILHNINSTAKDIILLGLLSDTPNKELTITNPGETQDEFNSGQLLWITHYLKLDGSIDLVGESQLLQKRYKTEQFSESLLDVNSAGYLERDQQGVGNLYRYSDWSSPVGKIGSGITPASNYVVDDVLRDGTISSNPKKINFVSGRNGSIGSPISISTRWIYAYKNQPGNYSDWVNLNPYTDPLIAGEGFFFKGTKDPATDSNITDQNMVFIGKPHNGDIKVQIFPEMYYLTGNPYPSGLDADQFLMDNLDSTSGVLYFWEHWGNDSHILSEYQAGYGTYTLAGGVGTGSGTQSENFNDGSQGTKTPQRYIPVGQGFYVNAWHSPGGDIKFNNDQRVYVTEASSQSIFFKSANSKKNQPIKKIEDARLKIKIGLDAPNIIHKQILLTIDERTTDGIDKGFDAQLFEVSQNDIYWMNSEDKLVIQAIGDLSVEDVIPLGISSKGNGITKIKVDTIENPYPDMEVYLRDNLTMNTYDIKDNVFEINLEEGEFNDKYSVVFQAKDAIPVENELLLSNILLFVNEQNTLIKVRKPAEINIKNISMFNVIGQQVKVWNSNLEANEIGLPIHLNTGVYLLNMETNKGSVMRKIIIK